MIRARTDTMLILFTACLALAACGGSDTEADGMAMEDTSDAMAMEEDVLSDDMGMNGDTLQAQLTGSAEVPGPGDQDGTGEASVWIEGSQVCFEIEVEGIADATAAHIHAGAEGEAGAPVVNFNVPENGLSGCVDADEQTISDIQASPSQYYVNVHNSEFGGGAVRGQLGSGMTGI